MEGDRNVEIMVHEETEGGVLVVVLEVEAEEEVEEDRKNGTGPGYVKRTASLKEASGFVLPCPDTSADSMRLRV